MRLNRDSNDSVLVSNYVTKDKKNDGRIIEGICIRIVMAKLHEINYIVS